MADDMSEQTDESADQPVRDLMAAMIAASLEASSLDQKTFMLVRLAALVAVDAPPLSYLGNLAVAGEAGISREDVQGVLTAIAPVVGTARVVAAVGNIARALGIVIMAAEEELEMEMEEENE
jgi:alkylhydroperoxidase/carboxymuconolactone decarboxylase family protein YurZ